MFGIWAEKRQERFSDHKRVGWPWEMEGTSHQRIIFGSNAWFAIPIAPMRSSCSCSSIAMAMIMTAFRKAVLRKIAKTQTE